MLGLAGIVGGAVLLVVFLPLPDWGTQLNSVRLALFNLGAIAIVIGVHRRQAWVAGQVAQLAAALAVLANAWHLVMMVVATAREAPFAGDFGLVYFYAGVSMWLTDAAFAVVTLRLGVVTRWGALALAIGSVLAILGMGRLELTTVANPTIFLPLSLIGVALNGLGWILLGLDLVMRGDEPAGQLV